MICTKRLKVIFLDLSLSNLILNEELKSIKELGINKIEKWIRESTKEEIKYYIDKNKKYKKKLPMAIIVRKIDKRVIGDVQLNYFEDINSIDIGYEIMQAYRKKGYAYEAVNEVIGYINNNYDFINIKARCFIDNTPSINLLKKLNMREVSRDFSLIYFEQNNIVKPCKEKTIFTKYYKIW